MPDVTNEAEALLASSRLTFRNYHLVPTQMLPGHLLSTQGLPTQRTQFPRLCRPSPDIGEDEMMPSNSATMTRLWEISKRAPMPPCKSVAKIREVLIFCLLFGI